MVVQNVPLGEASSFQETGSLPASCLDVVKLYPETRMGTGNEKMSGDLWSSVQPVTVFSFHVPRGFEMRAFLSEMRFSL